MATVWMGSPPEVHSALLSSGPGPGSVLAAAAAWSALSGEYAAVADELMTLLAAVQGGAWEGPTADKYVAAHAPYLAWLMQTSGMATDMAGRQESVAAAYTTALATMPTLVELAANHTIHGALVATNFFGINTIPIALNEADYVRMWIQAATTMSTYQAVAEAAVASAPPTAVAPAIVNSDAPADDHDGHDHGGNATPLDDVLADILRVLTGGRVIWDPAEGTVNGIPYDAYTNPGEAIWWVVRALELTQDFQEFARLLVTNPVEAIQFLVELELFDWPTHIAEIATWLSQSPQLLAVALGGAIANVGAVAGFAGLSGLAGIHPVVPAAVPPAAPAPPMLPVAGMAPTVSVATSVPAAPSAPAPAPSTVAAPGPAPPAPPAPAGFSFPFLVGGGPGIGFGSGMSAAASASAKRKAPEPDSAAVAAAAAARDQARARRRRRLVGRDYADEYLDMDVDSGLPPDDVWASDRGAGPVGFAGTVHHATAAPAAGLTAVADEFGAGPRLPMVPGTWDPDPAPPRG
ncbi:PPE family protein [Mycobacterium angelicum]|uniref:PPE family protein n=1 Tax=Mycobacterium angelicum TaxID=470074 RepID=A0A1W9ZRZ1_MYCAN|nr:PPE family protein [Mycobacterium angelicum]MCV7195550.1 PPE family protein [Mycobacterium angelicum]ORA20577.1 hypothetical protein BST12_14855 [Mycobacterium angelicum]